MTAREFVEEEINKHGIAIAYNSFIKGINWSKPLSDWDKDCLTVFDNLLSESD